jgi:hypothetical protein
MPTTSDFYLAVHDPLSSIIDDKTDGLEASMQFRDWMMEKTMAEAYEDDLEVYGPGLLSQKAEMQAIAIGTHGQGAKFRYIPTPFAGQLLYSKELVRDAKYAQVLRPAKRLKRAAVKTVEVDTAQMLVFGFDTNYTFGDGTPLFSASQPLPGGGTFSNLMATPASPSRAALISLTSQMRKTASHDGIDEMYEPKRVVCPTEQWAVWEEILGSAKAPEAGQFNAINVLHNKPGLEREVVALTYWNNTTTNWAVLTNCDNGPQLRWRDKMESDDWLDNERGTLHYSVYMRYAYGISDKRAIFGVNA